MKTLEVVEIASTQPKLTVAKDRVSMKFPRSMSDADRERVKAFMVRIADDLSDYHVTMRGSIKVHTGFMFVVMRNNDRSISYADGVSVE